MFALGLCFEVLGSSAREQIKHNPLLGLGFFLMVCNSDKHGRCGTPGTLPRSLDSERPANPTGPNLYIKPTALTPPSPTP